MHSYLQEDDLLPALPTVLGIHSLIVSQLREVVVCSLPGCYSLQFLLDLPLHFMGSHSFAQICWTSPYTQELLVLHLRTRAWTGWEVPEDLLPQEEVMWVPMSE